MKTKITVKIIISLVSLFCLASLVYLINTQAQEVIYIFNYMLKNVDDLYSRLTLIRSQLDFIVFIFEFAIIVCFNLFLWISRLNKKLSNLILNGDFKVKAWFITFFAVTITILIYKCISLIFPMILSINSFKYLIFERFYIFIVYLATITMPQLFGFMYLCLYDKHLNKLLF